MLGLRRWWLSWSSRFLLEGEQIQQADAVCAQLELSAVLGDEPPAGIEFVFGLVDIQQGVAGFGWEFGFGFRVDADGDAGVVEVDFVTCDGGGVEVVGVLQREGVALQPVGGGGANGHAEEGALDGEVAGEVEGAGEPVAGEEQDGGVHAEKVLSIEEAVIVACALDVFLEPLRVAQ